MLSPDDARSVYRKRQEEIGTVLENEIDTRLGWELYQIDTADLLDRAENGYPDFRVDSVHLSFVCKTGLLC
jgi:hypothetical protein